MQDMVEAESITPETHRVLRGLVDEMTGRQFARRGIEYFLHPVEKIWPEIAADYYAKIASPMDFSTLSRNVGDSAALCAYNTHGQFKRDLELIFKNAIAYNKVPASGGAGAATAGAGGASLSSSSAAAAGGASSSSSAAAPVPAAAAAATPLPIVVVAETILAEFGVKWAESAVRVWDTLCVADTENVYRRGRSEEARLLREEAALRLNKKLAELEASTHREQAQRSMEVALESLARDEPPPLETEAAPHRLLHAVSLEEPGQRLAHYEAELSRLRDELVALEARAGATAAAGVPDASAFLQMMMDDDGAAAMAPSAAAAASSSSAAAHHPPMGAAGASATMGHDALEGLAAMRPTTSLRPLASHWGGMASNMAPASSSASLLVASSLDGMLDEGVEMAAAQNVGAAAGGWGAPVSVSSGAATKGSSSFSAFTLGRKR